MYTLGTIREFHSANFSVIVDALEDDDLDLSWDEDGSTREGLESGRYIAFCARCRVFYHGAELASDYLGGCIYESIDAFADRKECGRQNRALAAKGRNRALRVLLPRHDPRGDRPSARPSGRNA